MFCRWAENCLRRICQATYSNKETIVNVAPSAELQATVELATTDVAPPSDAAIATRAARSTSAPAPPPPPDFLTGAAAPKRRGPPPPPMPASMIVSEDLAQVMAPSAKSGTPVRKGAALVHSPVVSAMSSSADVLLSPARRANPSPEVPMKAFFWVPVSSNRIVGSASIWSAGEAILTPHDATMPLDVQAAEFDLGLLHEHFSQKSNPRGGKRRSLGKPKTQLLPPQKKTSLGVVLNGKLKRVSWEAFRAAVYQDDSVLEDGTIVELTRLLPNADEQEVVLQYDMDASQLDSNEQYYLQMLEIPRIQCKLEGIAFKRAFDRACAHSEESLHSLVEACEVLRASTVLARLLQTVLMVGNYMNGGTARGGVRGFHLDALLKLDETRSQAKHPITLLQFLCQHLRTKDPEVFTLVKLIPLLSLASKVPLEQIRIDLREMNVSLRTLKAETDACAVVEDEEAFVQKMTPFYEFAQSRVEVLNSLLQSAQQGFDSLVEYFTANPVDTTPLTLFGTVQKFLGQMEKYS
eukprot:TRINITY_DN1765_c0_g1_i2.p1 TRINITY_DN1765_c0_g1~~TRINITY_DN1765_c0_g1_i2.p1  ORF type:complete len:522 (-),score=129.45 TRINITY_DN1765_c0_g1_i2:653-2218(-)